MSKPSRWKRFTESIFGEPPKEEINQGAMVISDAKQGAGVTPSEAFTDQVDLLNNDPCIKQTVEQFAEQVVSTGIFTTMDEKYSLKLPDSKGVNRTAKEVIDKWNKDNDLDSKLRQIAVELAALGNSFWYITGNGFVNIPVESIQRSAVSSKSVPISDKYDLVTTGSFGNKTLRSNTFIHFRINVTGNAPFGSGICLGLLATPDDHTPSLYDIRKSVRSSMKTGFEKFSFGNVYLGLPGMSDEKIGEYKTALEAMPETGARVVTNTDVKVGLEVPQRTQSYDKWIEQIDKEFYMALGGFKTPNTEFTTKATAESIAEAYKYSISAMRRILKRQIEALWAKILDEYGYDSDQANIKLHFGSEEVEYTLPDVFTAVREGIISKEDARNILIKYAKWEISNKAPTDIPVDEVKRTIESAKDDLTRHMEYDAKANFDLKQKQIKLLEQVLEGNKNEAVQ